LHQDDPLAPALLPLPSIELGVTSTDSLDMNSGEILRWFVESREIQRRIGKSEKNKDAT
jgi:hypothetical protein